MGQKGPSFANVYTGKALIADPIYQYAWFTVPGPEFPGEKTEKELLDTPWLQRLGLGKLPGDFRFRLFGRDWYIPLASTVLLSLVLSLAVKWI